MTGPRDPEKLKEIHRQYMAGKTMYELAKENGVTKQAISYNFRRHGLSTENGGAIKRTKLKKIDKKVASHSKKNAASLRIFGVAYTDSQKISRVYRDKYRNQRKRAFARGIGWEITLLEWMDVWIRSGKLEHRGIGVDKYVMARRGDIGPYRLDNIYIITSSDNIKEVRERERISKLNLVVAKKL